MIRNSLAFLVVAGLAAWTSQASACGNPATVWGQGTPPGGAVGGTVTVGQPSDVTPVRRYSGKCGSSFAAAGTVVRDGSPSNEGHYIMRGYFYTGIAGGTVKLFSAHKSDNSEMFHIDFNGTGLVFTTSGAVAGNTATIPAVANKWYSIETNWDRTLPTPAMAITVQGAGATTASTATINAAGAIAATDSIKWVEAGWVSSLAGTPTGAVNLDSFESRRATAIGRLCRGDANNDTFLSAADRVLITNEILNPSDPTRVSVGQPDTNEDGFISSADRVVLTNRILAADTCP